MKKTIFFGIIALLLAINADAQFRIGAKAGISSVSVSEDKIKDKLKDNTIGFYVGPTMEYLFNGKWGLDMSVLYTEKGIKFKDANTHRFGYIEIPLNAKYVYTLSDKVKVFGAAGPYFSFKVGGSKNFPVMIDNSREIWDVKKTGMGLNFTGGFELFHFLQLGITYGLGFMDNYKLSDGGGRVKDRVLSFSAAAYF